MLARTLNNAIVALAATGAVVFPESSRRAGAIADEGPKIGESERLRLVIETDAGGDPDDEQSLVRFLLYANEWDVEGIIANRPATVDGENLNRERTGLGIVRQAVEAYGQCQPTLVEHDRRYPTAQYLLQRTVAGYEDTEEGVQLVIEAVDGPDPRPLWFCNWGTGHQGASPSCLKRALDQVLRQRGYNAYARFKDRLRLSSDDQFGEHTDKLSPPWKLWVDTFRPSLGGRRWYHRFSALTAMAGGFDLERDVLTGHGPLGALYPTNTTHPQKEGDSMTFLYLVPTGMNDPNEPTWGSWAGRYGRRDDAGQRPYYWANESDTWQGTTSRDNTLQRWAAHLQNDFRARMDWCVKPRTKANHPPVARIEGPLRRTVESGTKIGLSAMGSEDPDGDALTFDWFYYPDGSYHDELAIAGAAACEASFVAPNVAEPTKIHIILTVSDDGTPNLVRYQRLVITVTPPSAR